MGRLCERPGCSDNAALTYGMRPEDLVFWIDILLEGESTEIGVLCLRHGDTMTVPRGWTLDDLRDPHLHLFRQPPRSDGPASRRNRSRRRINDDDTGQLALSDLIAEIDRLDSTEVSETADQVELGVDVGSAPSTSIETNDLSETVEAAQTEEIPDSTEVANRFETDDSTEAVDTSEIALPADASERTDVVDATEAGEVAQPEPPVELNWKPAFDDGDDLDGLLAARSPLLSRAFRGERG